MAVKAISGSCTATLVYFVNVHANSDAYAKVSWPGSYFCGPGCPLRLHKCLPLQRPEEEPLKLFHCPLTFSFFCLSPWEIVMTYKLRFLEWRRAPSIGKSCSAFGSKRTPLSRWSLRTFATCLAICFCQFSNCLTVLSKCCCFWQSPQSSDCFRQFFKRRQHFYVSYGSPSWWGRLFASSSWLSLMQC